MKYQLVYHPGVKKDLRSVPEKDRGRILTAIAGLADEPFSGKKLSGEYEGFYSLRVWPYRIIYQVLKTKLTILVVQIGQRGGAYK